MKEYRVQWTPYNKSWRRHPMWSNGIVWLYPVQKVVYRMIRLKYSSLLICTISVFLDSPWTILTIWYLKRLARYDGIKAKAVTLPECSRQSIGKCYSIHSFGSYKSQCFQLRLMYYNLNRNLVRPMASHWAHDGQGMRLSKRKSTYLLERGTTYNKMNSF